MRDGALQPIDGALRFTKARGDIGEMIRRHSLPRSFSRLRSVVTEDKITCVCIAPNAELIREHARRGGFPTDRVLEVASFIDPTTAEATTIVS